MMTQADNLRRAADDLAGFLRSLPDDADMAGWRAVTAMRDAASSLDQMPPPRLHEIQTQAMLNPRLLATVVDAHEDAEETIGRFARIIDADPPPPAPLPQEKP